MTFSTHTDGILVVDDNAEILDLLTDWLHSEGHRPVGVGSVPAALHLLRERSVGQRPVLITDFELGDQTGAMLLESVLAEGIDLGGVVVISGRASLNEDIAPVREKYKQTSTPFMVLPKPFSPSKLRAVLAGEVDDALSPPGRSTGPAAPNIGANPVAQCYHGGACPPDQPSRQGP